ncbi:YkgJ family cysteine cluster protein [Archaeoglobus neptunius]|uniref:YkgJ family cysteine cluster protein n=1 Tax=Archaeoglobus neptunius TaxID=2798580 RepID=UPI001928BA31
MELVTWKRVAGWRCRRCGKCCRDLDIMVTPEEERRLQKYGEVFERGKILTYLRKLNGKCIFLRGNTCTIYSERPMACVKYPFYFRLKGDAEAFFQGIYVYVDPSCPGLKITRCPVPNFEIAAIIYQLLKNEKLIIV